MVVGAAHHHQYDVVPIGAAWRAWQPAETAAGFGSADVKPRPRAGEIWYALRRGPLEVDVSTPTERFGLDLRLEPTAGTGISLAEVRSAP